MKLDNISNEIRKCSINSENNFHWSLKAVTPLSQCSIRAISNSIGFDIYKCRLGLRFLFAILKLFTRNFLLECVWYPWEFDWNLKLIKYRTLYWKNLILIRKLHLKFKKFLLDILICTCSYYQMEELCIWNKTFLDAKIFNICMYTPGLLHQST